MHFLAKMSSENFKLKYFLFQETFTKRSSQAWDSLLDWAYRLSAICLCLICRLWHPIHRTCKQPDRTDFFVNKFTRFSALFHAAVALCSSPNLFDLQFFIAAVRLPFTFRYTCCLDQLKWVRKKPPKFKKKRPLNRYELAVLRNQATSSDSADRQPHLTISIVGEC